MLLHQMLSSIAGLRSRRVVLATALISVLATVTKLSRAADVPAPSPAKLERITEFFDSEVTAGRLPGAVVLIQQHGRLVYLKCFGVQDVATNVPMTADTIFALHSMTKPITSVAAMMLVDAGLLSTLDPVSKYLPAFSDEKVAVETSDENGGPVLKLLPPTRPMTVMDLLRQTSGITYEYLGEEWIQKLYTQAHLFDGHFDNAVFADRIAKLPLTQQPGTLWRYGHSTDVVGRLIEIISGQTLYQFEKERIFDPLGMTSTKYVLASDNERARMAEPLPSDTNLVEAEKERRAHPEWQSGGGGLVSTALDYSRFAQMILNGGQLDGKRYLSPSAFKDMTSDHIGPGFGVAHDHLYFPGDGFSYGYGFAVRTYPGLANPPPSGSIGELKWDSGSGTYFGVDPKLDMVYIMMEQTQNERGRITRIFRKLVYDAFGAGK